MKSAYQDIRHAGFSLVEIMVGMVIGLLATIVIFQVFAVSEGQKRTTTSGADAQQNGLMALYQIERDIRMSGFGTTAFACTVIKAYDAARTPAAYDMSPFPATVSTNSPAAGSDSIDVLYSNDAMGRVPTTIETPMATSSAAFNVVNGLGMAQTNLVVLSQAGQPCSMLQASADAQNVGASWSVQHGATLPRNPPTTTNTFPVGGYTSGALAFNLGTPINRRYFVQNGSLMMQDLLQPVSATNPIALINGIVALRAQYGRDALPAGAPDGVLDTWDNTAPAVLTEVVAIRIAVVARSGLGERDAVSPATLTLWPSGPTMALNAAAQRFRYRVYHTIVPIRNVIWNS